MRQQFNAVVVGNVVMVRLFACDKEIQKLDHGDSFGASFSL